jgi:phosphatidylinositol-3-phosphatase
LPVFHGFPGGPRAPYDQLIGQGCVFPATVGNIADELELAGYTWKGYMQDMALEKSGGSTSPTGACVRPDLNAQDGTNSSDAEEQYATRHNPFLFFHSIIDDPARCTARDVDLEQLRADLGSYATTPNYSFITPDNCNNAHDPTCTDGGAGDLERANEFMKEWVPLILASEAYQRDGMLIVMFDEATPFGPGPDDNAACCGQAANPGPNTTQPGVVGPGGGRYGAVILSRFTKPGSVNETPYNHYSILRTVQDLFNAKSNGYLGFAGLPPEDGMHAFGSDVYNCGG